MNEQLKNNPKPNGTTHKGFNNDGIPVADVVLKKLVLWPDGKRALLFILMLFINNYLLKSTKNPAFDRAGVLLKGQVLIAFSQHIGETKKTDPAIPPV